jgi:glycosyltransferase involved in cell wall biosynthesis
MSDPQTTAFLSVVLPCYREATHIKAVALEISSELASAGVQYELVMIDDGSPDNTWQALVELAAQLPNVRAARLSRNFGKELALVAGLELARGEAVITMDADGQHPPALLPVLIEAWRESNADIVEAAKLDRGKESFITKTGAGLFYFLWNKLSGFEMRGASDYKLLSRKAVNAYLQMDERNVFYRGMTAWLGFERVQVPFQVPERAGGVSSWSILRLVRLALTGITAFSAIPLQMVTFAGVIFLLFAFLFGLQTAYVYLSGHAVTGFATVIFLLLIIGSMLMISLGIIGIYLARIYDEIKRRPRYLISSMTEEKRVDERN